MAIEIRVPALGESVTEATVGQWFKKVGDPVKTDDILVELETDKVTLEVRAQAAGMLASIDVPKGTTVAVGAQLGAIRAGEGTSAPAPATQSAQPAQPAAGCHHHPDGRHRNRAALFSARRDAGLHAVAGSVLHLPRNFHAHLPAARGSRQAPPFRKGDSFVASPQCSLNLVCIPHEVDFA